MQAQLNELYEKLNFTHTQRNEVNKLIALHGIKEFNRGYKIAENEYKTIEKWSNRN